MTILFKKNTVLELFCIFAQFKKMKSLHTSLHIKKLFFATHVKTKFKVLKYFLANFRLCRFKRAGYRKVSKCANP